MNDRQTTVVSSPHLRIAWARPKTPVGGGGEAAVIGPIYDLPTINTEQLNLTLHMDKLIYEIKEKSTISIDLFCIYAYNLQTKYPSITLTKIVFYFT